MNITAKQLYDRALELPDAERAELAARLIESLDTEVDQDLDATWDTEIKHRLEQLDSGEVAAVPWPEARRMIMERSDGASDA